MASHRQEFNRQIIASVQDLHSRLQIVENALNVLLSQLTRATGGANATQNPKNSTAGTDRIEDTTTSNEGG